MNAQARAYMSELGKKGGRASAKGKKRDHFVMMGIKSGQAKRARIKALKEQKGVK